MVRRNQHNVDIATKHLPGACGGHEHDVRKGTRRVPCARKYAVYGFKWGVHASNNLSCHA